jgi:hypothetical protein
MAFDNHLFKVLSPIERLIGATLLGAATVRSFNGNFFNNGFSPASPSARVQRPCHAFTALAGRGNSSTTRRGGECVAPCQEAGLTATGRFSALAGGVRSIFPSPTAADASTIRRATRTTFQVAGTGQDLGDVI